MKYKLSPYAEQLRDRKVDPVRHLQKGARRVSLTNPTQEDLAFLFGNSGSVYVEEDRSPTKAANPTVPAKKQ